MNVNMHAQSHPTLCNSMNCSPPGSSLSMDSSRQEYYSMLFPTPGYLPDLGIKPAFPEFPALAGGFFTTVPPGKPNIELCKLLNVLNKPKSS